MPDRINNSDPEFNVLGNILETLRFQSSIFFRSELAAPWGMSLTQIGSPRFHIALSGDCFVGACEGENILVQEMDIIMLPNGNQHWIADQPGRELTPSQQAGEACELGSPLFQEGEITNRLMCGLVQFDTGSAHPILDSLPQVMHFPHIETTDPIWMTVTLIDTEMRTQHSRSGPIVDRLTEVLFLQLLNRHIIESESVTGFFAALRDHRVHQALSLIHQRPDFNWSLSSLGEQIGMSRATLVRHFQDTVGVSPMAYVSNWRLTRAYNLVKHSSDTLEQIADSVGFASGRSLSRAFQRQYNITPNELRHS